MVGNADPPHRAGQVGQVVHDLPRACIDHGHGRSEHGAVTGWWRGPAYHHRPAAHIHIVHLRHGRDLIPEQLPAFKVKGRGPSAPLHDREHLFIHGHGHVGQPHHRRQRTLERVHTFELPADVRCFPTHGGAQRNGSAVGVPNDAAGRLRR